MPSCLIELGNIELLDKKHEKHPKLPTDFNLQSTFLNLINQDKSNSILKHKHVFFFPELNSLIKKL